MSLHLSTTHRLPTGCAKAGPNRGGPACFELGVSLQPLGKAGLSGSTAFVRAVVVRPRTENRHPVCGLLRYRGVVSVRQEGAHGAEEEPSIRDEGKEPGDDGDQRSGPKGNDPGRASGHESDPADVPEDTNPSTGLSHSGLGLDGQVFAGGDDSAVQALIAQRIISRSGPLPDPEDLAGFERALPGCAERIVRMAEKAQDAAIEDGHLSTRAEASALKWTAVSLSLVPLLMMGVAGFLAFVGKSTGAAWVAVAAAAVGGLPRVVEALKARPGPSRRDGS